MGVRYYEWMSFKAEVDSEMARLRERIGILEAVEVFFIEKESAEARKREGKWYRRLARKFRRAPRWSEID